MNGIEEKLWKSEIWNFKVETSKLKLRSPESSLLSWNCESEFESSNLKLQTAISDLSLQTSNLQTKAANCKSWDLQTSICKLESWESSNFESSNGIRRSKVYGDLTLSLQTGIRRSKVYGDLRLSLRTSNCKLRKLRSSNFQTASLQTGIRRSKIESSNLETPKFKPQTQTSKLNKLQILKLGIRIACSKLRSRN